MNQTTNKTKQKQKPTNADLKWGSPAHMCDLIRLAFFFPDVTILRGVNDTLFTQMV